MPSTPPLSPLQAVPKEDALLLQRKFDELLAADAHMASFFRRLHELGGRAVVFGGWARDMLLEDRFGGTGGPGDIDLVSEGLPQTRLRTILPDGTTLNGFGGFATDAFSIKLDIWDIRDTYTLTKRGWALELDLLPHTTVFTHEAIIFRPAQFFGTPSAAEAGLYDVIRSGTIHMNQGEVRCVAYQVGRVLQHSARLKLKLGQDVESFIRAVLQQPTGASDVQDWISNFGRLGYKRPTRAALRRYL